MRGEFPVPDEPNGRRCLLQAKSGRDELSDQRVTPCAVASWIFDANDGFERL